MTVLFFSYSHADSDLRDQLEKHLAMLKHQGRIDAWHDRKIVAGDALDSRISENLERAEIVLLLVSSDFLSSAYCYGIEMRRAMERNAEGSARVIPIILRPCDWKSAPFGQILATPKDGKPVTRWADRDEAWLDVVEAIKGALPSERKAIEPTRRPPLAPTKGLASAEALTGPRSSNLRVRKQFTDVDRSRFLRNAFEFVSNFFRNSLEELQQRNTGIQTEFTQVDAHHFTAIVYRNGKATSQCQIRFNPSSVGFGSGITFSYDVSNHGNSYNENMSVETDDQSLYLKPFGMRGIGGQRDTHLSEEGAAEYFWEMLIGDLQR